MKKILLIGNSPLPEENVKFRPAAGLRTYQFLKPLLQLFSIRMINIAMPDCYEEAPKYKEIRHSDKFVQIVIPKDDPSLRKTIQSAHDEFLPDAIIGVNTYPSYIASLIHSQAPFWADLNGWIMAEAQAQAYKMDSNDYIPHYYQMEKNILKWADKFSTVSEPQKYAVLGELAALGRLNKETFGYEFSHHIPNGIEWFSSEMETYELKNYAGFKNIPADAFVLLWMGGYNTWVDEITLFKAVEAAMRQCKKLYFASTGGKIEGLDNKTFIKFRELVDKSEYKNRFIFLGWVKTEDIPYIYMRADCGLNVDRKCVETSTGARNRINEMMKFGVPVITTAGSEISYEVEKAGAGIVIPENSENFKNRYELLAEAIADMYGFWRGGGEAVSRKYAEFKERGQKYILEECNYEKLIQPLMKWLLDPRPAQDRYVKIKLEGLRGKLGKIRGSLRYLKESGWSGWKKFFKKVWRI